MATIVGICELGGYLGHISKITSLLHGLRELGHQIVAVLPNNSLVDFMELQHPPIPYVLGPKLTMPAFKASRDPANLSEVLLCAGMGTHAVLDPCANLWRQLLLLLKADLILADYAPTPLLAARTLGLKSVVLGTGFSVPPVLSPIPAFNRRLNIQDSVLAASDLQLVSVLNEYLQRFDAPMLTGVSDLYWQSEFVGITHYQAFDHFAYARPEHTAYYALATQISGGIGVSWPEGTGLKVFAYLKTEYPGLEFLLRWLQSAEVKAVIYISGDQADKWLHLQTQHLRIYLQPVDLTELLPAADWLIYHAGSGMASQALRNGKASILIPIHYEQLFTAEAMVSRQLGYLLNPHWSAAQVALLMQKALADEGMQTRCAAYIQGSEQLGREDLIARINGIFDC